VAARYSSRRKSCRSRVISVSHLDGRRTSIVCPNCHARSIMVVCPNCNYQNPENATQCEACFTPLPPSAACPQCGASVPVGASFCGQCGFALPSALSSPSEPPAPVTNGDRATTPTSESPQTVICAETQLQAPVARLVHSDTQAILEIPANLSI